MTLGVPRQVLIFVVSSIEDLVGAVAIFGIIVNTNI